LNSDCFQSKFVQIGNYFEDFREQDIPSATCVAYSSLNHLAYVGNRKGELIIYDIRMLKVLKKIDAHESSVKAITIDPEEYYFSTGSSEGNIKVGYIFLEKLK
jgi:WD40 repeat protein